MPARSTRTRAVTFLIAGAFVLTACSAPAMVTAPPTLSLTTHVPAARTATPTPAPNTAAAKTRPVPRTPTTRKASSVAAAPAPRVEVPAIGKETTALGGATGAYLSAAGPQQETVAVYDMHTGQTLEYRHGRLNDTASIVKLDILETLLAQAGADHRALTDDERGHARPMIEHSSDNDATALWGDIGGGTAISRYNAGGPHTTSTTPGANGWWGWTTTTAIDQLRLVHAVVVTGSLLSDPARSYAAGLLTRVEKAQTWGKPRAAGKGSWVKVGWMTQNSFGWSGVPTDNAAGWTINSIGHIVSASGSRNYLVAILTKNNATEAAGIALCNKIGELIYAQMAER